MDYIFINPVVDKMYIADELNYILSKNNYERINVNNDWHGIVKKKYKEVINGTIIRLIKTLNILIV